MRGDIVTQEVKREKIGFMELSLLQKKERSLKKKQAWVFHQFMESVENCSVAKKLEQKMDKILEERREIEKKNSLMKKKIFLQLKERKVVENIRENNYYCSSSPNKDTTKKDATHLFFQNI